MQQRPYKLLCRMGCYRYQDVPAVPTEGLLCLLWDVPEPRQKRVIRSLQERSLVEFEDGEYWLHPVIRADAISRLKTTLDWKTANYQAANFWTHSVKTTDSLEDALKAFEAYHHYVEINDFDLACEALIKERKNTWFTRLEEGETTAWSFYRLGLYQKSISAINQLRSNINSGYPLSKLNSLLGVMYWASGQPYLAIQYHEQSKEKILDFRAFNDLELSHKYKIMEVNYLINLGLCKIDLWELKESIDFFQKAISFSLSEKLNYYAGSSEVLVNMV
jgi:tetratricopeptide (TPR) repeat protein